MYVLYINIVYNCHNALMITYPLRYVELVAIEQGAGARELPQGAGDRELPAGSG